MPIATRINASLKLKAKILSFCCNYIKSTQFEKRKRVQKRNKSLLKSIYIKNNEPVIVSKAAPIPFFRCSSNRLARFLEALTMGAPSPLSLLPVLGVALGT